MSDAAERVSTGVEGLDVILHGGLPRGRIILLEGAPGTGKTTLALQMLVASAARGEKALFLSVAQSRPELDMKRTATASISALSRSTRPRSAASPARLPYPSKPTRPT